MFFRGHDGAEVDFSLNLTLEDLDVLIECVGLQLGEVRAWSLTANLGAPHGQGRVVLPPLVALLARVPDEKVGPSVFAWFKTFGGMPSTDAKEALGALVALCRRGGQIFFTPQATDTRLQTTTTTTQTKC